MISEKKSYARFGVPDISKVTVIAVMNIRKQVEVRKENYTCKYKTWMRSPKTGEYEVICGAGQTISSWVEPVRCIDIPLEKCPFVPVSTATGKELNPRYVQKKDSEN